MTLKEYLNSLQQKLKPEELAGIDTQINFELKENPLFVTIKNQNIEVSDGVSENPEVNIKAKEEDLLSIINGDTNPMMAMMLGKLKISNPAAMMKYAKILGLM